jgi:hypothetical protein
MPEKKRPVGAPRVIEPNAVYDKAGVAAILSINPRTLQRYEDLPWSDLGEHTPRMLGSELLAWLKARRRAA